MAGLLLFLFGVLIAVKDTTPLRRAIVAIVLIILGLLMLFGLQIPFLVVR